MVGCEDAALLFLRPGDLRGRFFLSFIRAFRRTLSALPGRKYDRSRGLGRLANNRQKLVDPIHQTSDYHVARSPTGCTLETCLIHAEPPALRRPGATTRRSAVTVASGNAFSMEERHFLFPMRRLYQACTVSKLWVRRKLGGFSVKVPGTFQAWRQFPFVDFRDSETEELRSEIFTASSDRLGFRAADFRGFSGGSVVMRQRISWFSWSPDPMTPPLDAGGGDRSTRPCRAAIPARTL